MTTSFDATIPIIDEEQQGHNVLDTSISKNAPPSSVSCSTIPHRGIKIHSSSADTSVTDKSFFSEGEKIADEDFYLGSNNSIPSPRTCSKWTTVLLLLFLVFIIGLAVSVFTPLSPLGADSSDPVEIFGKTYYPHSTKKIQLASLPEGTLTTTTTIPTELALLTKLTHLDLSSNPWIAGTIPISALTALTSLKYLDLAGLLHLEGTIPPELFFALPELQHLDLGLNSLHGSIPSSSNNSSMEDAPYESKLTYLNLMSNHLTGTIPSSLASLSKLTKLSLLSNALEGTVPSELSTLVHLKSIYLQDNDLSGSISYDLCKNVEVIIDCSEMICPCCRSGEEGPERNQCPNFIYNANN